MKKSMKKVLCRQKYYYSYLDDLFEIINKAQPECFGLSLIAIDYFNYGVMIGKRQERERHRKCDIK
ncbi:hypothetical protein ACYUJ6_02090 [Clostridium sp. JNZ X4-2]